MKALHNYSFAENVYSRFKAVDNPSAKIYAYKGALEAIMTKTTWNVVKKLSYLRASQESFEKAVELAPNDLEVRYMRLAVEHEIPRFLGMSEHIEEDKKFVINHLHQFNPTYLPASVRKEIVGFAKKCGYFSKLQIALFESIMTT